MCVSEAVYQCIKIVPAEIYINFNMEKQYFPYAYLWLGNKFS